MAPKTATSYTTPYPTPHIGTHASAHPKFHADYTTICYTYAGSEFAAFFQSNVIRVSHAASQRESIGNAIAEFVSYIGTLSQSNTWTICLTVQYPIGQSKFECSPHINSIGNANVECGTFFFSFVGAFLFSFIGAFLVAHGRGGHCPAR